MWLSAKLQLHGCIHEDVPVCHKFLVVPSAKLHDGQYITHQCDQLLAGMAHWHNTNQNQLGMFNHSYTIGVVISL